MITFEELKIKDVRKSAFCTLSIADAGNMDLAGTELSTVLPTDLYIRSQRQIQHTVLPMPSLSNQSKVYFLKLQILRHLAIVGIAVG